MDGAENSQLSMMTREIIDGLGITTEQPVQEQNAGSKRKAERDPPEDVSQLEIVFEDESYYLANVGTKKLKFGKQYGGYNQLFLGVTPITNKRIVPLLRTKNFETHCSVYGTLVKMAMKENVDSTATCAMLTELVRNPLFSNLLLQPFMDKTYMLSKVAGLLDSSSKHNILSYKDGDNVKDVLDAMSKMITDSCGMIKKIEEFTQLLRQQKSLNKGSRDALRVLQKITTKALDAVPADPATIAAIELMPAIMDPTWFPDASLKAIKMTFDGSRKPTIEKGKCVKGATPAEIAFGRSAGNAVPFSKFSDAHKIRSAIVLSHSLPLWKLLECTGLSFNLVEECRKSLKANMVWSMYNICVSLAKHGWALDKDVNIKQFGVVVTRTESKSNSPWCFVVLLDYEESMMAQLKTSAKDMCDYSIRRILDVIGGSATNDQAKWSNVYDAFCSAIFSDSTKSVEYLPGEDSQASLLEKAQ